MYLVAILTKSLIGQTQKVKATLSTIGLKKKHTLLVAPQDSVLKGKIKKGKSCLMWTILSELPLGESGIRHLSSPKKGFYRNLPRTGYVEEKVFKLTLERMIA